METVVSAILDYCPHNVGNAIYPFINYFSREILPLICPLPAAPLLVCRRQKVLRNMPPDPWPSVFLSVDVWRVP
ncbi:hypothetical protein PSPO01_16269 [Paraphaeosphaeria sporulosa]